ncbi:MAG: peptidase S41 [Bacteroidetes bacterium GWA2_31_9]|nr:MAG: peptidase S41 [Bacteroidetes bacterium GWA2_31_9]
MFKKLKYILIIGITAIVVFAYKGIDESSFEVSKNLDIYYTLFKELNMFYVDETKPGDLIKNSIDKMLETLDPYTVYIPESKMEDYRLMTTGQYGGIGALIRKAGDYIVITEPYETFPAYKAGIKAGDVILEIDGNSTKNKNSSDISDALKGQPNSEVKLVLKRPGTEKNIEKTLKREEIKISSVPYHGVIADGIGYLRLSSFTEQAGAEVKAAFTDLKENNKITSLVLDLRGNPGGLLIEAVNIVNVFVKKGEEVVSTKGKISDWNKKYTTMFQSTDTEIPIVCLVNSGSASASEIVSGALQDLDRAVILGQRTFGKGLVQTTRQLSYNSKLKVTTAKYYIPSGRCIQALDYTHRNEDGSVGKVPDSLITEFATKNGRKVYDGGGIVPDIATEPIYLSKIAISLIEKNLIFDYVTEFVLKHDSIDNPEKFSISDVDFDEFKKYLSDKEFDYETESEKELTRLIDIAKKEKYYEKAETDFAELKLKLSHDKNYDIQKFKDEITELLNEEIVSRYYYQKGRAKSSIKFDDDVKKAIELLQDKSKYDSILVAGVDIKK